MEIKDRKLLVLIKCAGLVVLKEVVMLQYKHSSRLKREDSGHLLRHKATSLTLTVNTSATKVYGIPCSFLANIHNQIHIRECTLAVRKYSIFCKARPWHNKLTHSRSLSLAYLSCALEGMVPGPRIARGLRRAAL